MLSPSVDRKPQTVVPCYNPLPDFLAAGWLPLNALLLPTFTHAMELSWIKLSFGGVSVNTGTDASKTFSLSLAWSSVCLTRSTEVISWLQLNWDKAGSECLAPFSFKSCWQSNFPGTLFVFLLSSQLSSSQVAETMTHCFSNLFEALWVKKVQIFFTMWRVSYKIFCFKKL